MPDGQLTPVQFEIMDLVWSASVEGLTVAMIWQVVAARRTVARTTILNLVDRLEKRGWLRREAGGEAARYVPAVTREAASANLAGEFVTDFFGGSASSLVMSLLGAEKLDSAEIARLREMLDTATSKSKGSRTRPTA